MTTTLDDRRARGRECRATLPRAASPFGFLWGAAAIMAHDLASTPTTGMPLVIHLDDTRYDLDDDRRAIVGRLRIILQVKEARASVREPYTGTHRALCGWALARSHARSGDAAQVAAYLGGRDGFDQAVISYAEEYPRTTRRDHVRLLEAIGAAEVTASEDPFRAAR